MEYIPRAITKIYSNLIPVFGKGSWITSIDGKKYLDLTSGIGALSLGHSHPELLKYVSRQMKDIIHVPQQVFKASVPLLELNNSLHKTMPSSCLDRFFYVNSGSEATDNAIKISRKYTQKQNIIAIRNGFHGRTLGALSLNSSSVQSRKNSQPLMPGVFFSNDNIEDLEEIFNTITSPDETSAIIFESIQGEGGIKSISKKFLKETREICSNHNILLIADEVQCGSMRTGSFWNIEQKNIIPDIITFGKGIASGFPIAGLGTKKIIIDSLSPNFLGGTYGGNALTTSAANKTIELLSRNNEIEINIKKQSEKLKDALLSIKNRLSNNKKNNNNSINIKLNITDIRIFGLMIGIETETPEQTNYIIEKLLEKNILVLKAGYKGNIIRLLPPLNISDDEIDIFINALNDIFTNN